MTARELGWDGGRNLRDLGGLPLADGGETRFGAVVRSAGIAGLTPAGWEALQAYGIRTIVDLRCPTEHEGVRRSAVPVVHAPLFELDDRAFRAAMAATRTWTEFYALVAETRADRVARAVAAVADAPEGGVLVHCLAGKDRTGILAALLLSIAGVPDRAIGEDHSASEAALRPHFEAWEEGCCDARWILDLLARLRSRHGSIRGYLLAAGATPEQLARVRVRLRGP